MLIYGRTYYIQFSKNSSCGEICQHFYGLNMISTANLWDFCNRNGDVSSNHDFRNQNSEFPVSKQTKQVETLVEMDFTNKIKDLSWSKSPKLGLWLPPYWSYCCQFWRVECRALRTPLQRTMILILLWIGVQPHSAGTETVAVCNIYIPSLLGHK